MNTKLPIKLALANCFMDGSEHNTDDVYNLMRRDYVGEEKLCSPETIDSNLQALKTVGIIKVSKEHNGYVYYQISDYGREKVKRNLPEKYRA